MKTRFAVVAFLVLSSCVPVAAAEKLSLHGLFSDHAVLQRDMAVPVWGRAEPGRKVTVSFAGQTLETTAEKDGRWQVNLEPLAASAEGRKLTVRTDNEADTPLERSDVLVGEVWVCSGQSNMGWGLVGSIGGKEAAAAAGDDGLRLFNVHAVATDEPQPAVVGLWAVDSSTSALNFSGVAYFYGLELRKHVKVPVGLIKSAVGGTVAESWTPRAELETNPTLKPLLDQQADRVAA